MADQVTIVGAQQRFKKTPAGEIPVDWDCVKLGEIISLEYGRSLPEHIRSGGAIPVYGSNGLVGHHDEALGKGPGIIVGRKGSVGAVVWSPSDFWPIDTTYFVAGNRSKAAMRWLYYVLCDLDLQKLNTSSGVPGLNRDAAYERSIPLPPIDEQKKIAEILSTVDEAIERSESAAEKSRHLHASLVQQLVSRGIGHSRFKDTQLGKLPEDWKVLPLEKVAEVERGKFSHRPRNEPRFYGGPYPFIQTGEVTASGGRIRTYTQSLNDEGLAISRLFPKGTILMTIAANIGETAIAEFDVAFPDSLVGIVATENMDNRFLEYYLRTRKKHLNGLAPASAQKNINLETLRPYPVPLPPRKEQVAIADALDALATRNAAEQAFLIRLDSLKMALMKVLLTGIVRARQVQSI